MDKIDPHFRVEVIEKTHNPNRLMYLAMHQDYSSGFVFDSLHSLPDERKLGGILVKKLLNGQRGHYGVLEHPQITFNCGWFPHSVIQQARTHRISTSFDVQSMRYTGDHFYEIGEEIESTVKDFGYGVESVIYNSDDILEMIDKAFYIRPEGVYTDRNGSMYGVTPAIKMKEKIACGMTALQYKKDIDYGYSEEHARGKLPFDYRQHFVVSFNARSLLHFLDLRAKKDSQLEIRQLCDLMWPHFKEWVPAIAEWYEKNRYGKAKLSP